MLRIWIRKRLNLLISYICQCVDSEQSKRNNPKQYDVSFVVEHHEGNKIHRKTFITFSDLFEQARQGKDVSIGVSQLEVPEGIIRYHFHAPPLISGTLVDGKVQWHTPPPDLTANSDEGQRKLDVKYSPFVVGYDRGSEILGWPPTR